MFLLLKNAEICAPERLGRRDILCAAGKIVAMAERIDGDGLPGEVEVFDASGLLAAPGLIDAHVHAIGGGGEGGFATRTPELAVSACVLAGVTTIVGTLGTDSVARSMETLVAKVYSLREEGISAWCYTGSYRVPMRTVTGDAMKDLMMIEPVIGLGELAISDHRSSLPSREELARIASEARVGGMLSGKAGIVNFHVGDAPAALKPLEELVLSGELPRSQFLPTHCNRSPAVFASALAWARNGGFVDFTTSAIRRTGGDGALSAARALRSILEAGLSLDQTSCTSDGQGSLPRFDASGSFVDLGIGCSSSLWESLREAILSEGIPLETALKPATSSPATMLKLRGKGRIAVGADADLIIVEPKDYRLVATIALGKVAMREGRSLLKGKFEDS